MRVRILGVLATLAALIALVVVYFVFFLEQNPPAVAAAPDGPGAVRLTLMTVPSYGHHPFPDWVSYMVRDASAHWKHPTIYKLPAPPLVHVTVYQFDSQTGL